MSDWLERPHRRLNPLTREWVLVSPQRATRPWQGQIEPATDTHAPSYDPACYLCPGNPRAGGVRNPSYTSTFVFDNDFPALLPDGPEGSLNQDDLLVAESEHGICRVICFSPRHDLAISQMPLEALEAVVDTWCDQARQLAGVPWIRYVQIFENRGALMGASNPHPHCQVWATQHVPNELVKEGAAQELYRKEHGSCLLCDYAAAERDSERVVCTNESFFASVPFWAVWPFEVIVIARRHICSLEQMNAAERSGLGQILKSVTSRYDALFGVPFPYTMGFHVCPAGGDPSSWHLHAHFYPPLLRSATIRKFMVGFEMLAMPQRDITPEMAAERLRAIAPAS